jgi:Na+-driven multidrug efflux pump
MLAPVVGLAPEGSATAMAVAMGATTVVALVVFLKLRPRPVPSELSYERVAAGTRA